MSAVDPSAFSSSGAHSTRPRLLDELHGLIDDVRDAVQARARLFALETRKAGLALAQMLMFGVMAGLLVLTAWVSLVAATVALAVQLGAELWWVLLIVVVINVGIAAALLLAIRERLGDLRLTATMRQLGPKPHREAASEPAAAQRSPASHDRPNARSTQPIHPSTPAAPSGLG